MKSMFFATALIATAAFAKDAPKLPDPSKLPFDSIREVKVEHVIDSLKAQHDLAFERAKDSAEFKGHIPDSIKVKIEARRESLKAFQDSMKGKKGEEVRAHLDSLRGKWEAKRAEEIAKLPADVQAKIKERIAALEAKHDDQGKKIEARREEIRAKIKSQQEAEKGKGKNVTPPTTTP